MERSTASLAGEKKVKPIVIMVNTHTVTLLTEAHDHPYNFWHLEESADAWPACCLLGQLVGSILWLFSHSSAPLGHSHNTDPGRAEQCHPASMHNNKK